jgi:hypothetical protein
MNAPNFKELLQKLSVFKSNLSLLVSVIITVVAVLVFIPNQLLSGGLKKQMEQKSLSLGTEVKSQSKRAVAREQWQELARLQEVHRVDANRVGLLAEQSARRELLRYDIFPQPDANNWSPVIFKRFGEKYRAGIDRRLAGLNANDCPTQVEIENALKAQQERTRMSGRLNFESYSAYNPYNPRASSVGRRTGYDQVRNTIVDEICLSRAKSCALYAKPSDISGYTFWADYKYDVNMVEAVKDCWYYQLGNWVIEDILDTTAAMNSGHQNVLTAPVKRLMRVSFTMGLSKWRAVTIFTGVRKSKNQQDRADSDRPAYVIEASDGLTESCTGRLCDEDIDVIHFNVSVVLSARDIMPFMQELCSGKSHRFYGWKNESGQPQSFKHNQITILESNIRSISADEPDHRYYRYGDDPVVEADLICEYVFNKKGFKYIENKIPKNTKPDSVLKALGEQSGSVMPAAGGV